jgi:hypothetical protein
MTRCLLAMLNSQDSFYPPKKLISAWSSFMMNTKHHSSEEINLLMESLPYKRGLVLCSAFEMLYQAHKQFQQSGTSRANGGGGSGALLMDSIIANHCCQSCISNIASSVVEGKDCCWFCGEVNWLKGMSKRPIDDESWMNVTPEELEAILLKSSPPPIIDQADQNNTEASSGDASDKPRSVKEDGELEEEEEEEEVDALSGKEGVERLGKIVEGINTFLNASSEVGGVQLPHDVGENGESSVGISFDVNKFMSALKGSEYVETERDVWGDDGKNSDDSDDDDDVDDDVDDDDFRNETNDEGDQLRTTLEAESDNNDDEDDEYSHAYSHAMNRELDDTVLGHSFERVSHDVVNSSSDKTTVDKEEKNYSNDKRGAEEGGEDALKEDEGEEEEEEEDIKPVDLDANLVKHLLESYASQEGLAGPASNLLHEMGLFFPKTSTSTKTNTNSRSEKELQKNESSGSFFNSAFTSENASRVPDTIFYPLGESEQMYMLD